MSTTLHLLMQASTQPAGPGGAPMGPAGFLTSPMFLILLMFGVFYFFMIRGNRKEKQKKKDMLSALARNDRVLTIGGIIGTVVQVRDDQIVIKIDESTNTKMNILRSAVRQVLTDEETPTEIS